MRRGVFWDWLVFEIKVTRVAGMMIVELVRLDDSEPVEGEIRES